ncbi:MAG: DNA-directed RNA polymerase subunit omega [Verrucomicrobia bacterium]|jgi:DNA-directed RNA polymerase subunit omega|nr:MAG: DNA-directed RNA polymerase subunit omega [Verrucomicrobiota bacterium]MDH4469488.1 DNA-directed RNA polymerase subunit omega [Verrucomicrobiae bacterium]
MNSQIIEQASQVVPNKQLLINMVSKRVRQLMAGSRPLIDNSYNMGLADIALSEIAAGNVSILNLLSEKDTLE